MEFFFGLKCALYPIFRIIKKNIRSLQLVLKPSTRDEEILIGPEDLITARDWACFIDSLIDELKAIRNKGKSIFKKNV